MNIGERLKIAREAIGYTQKKAAEVLGDIGESSISEFETGNRQPKLWQLSRLAEIYRQPVEFFFSENPIPREVLLWRDVPQTNEERKEAEAKFTQLCEQYRKLELLLDEVRQVDLPQPDVTNVRDFDYKQANAFASKVRMTFQLGDVPIASLKTILEEQYYVKVFYLDFTVSSISTVQERFGPAILLNHRNKQWRRSFDLAHELFHILTWSIFAQEHSKDSIASKKEESLANAFASRLLLPEESMRNRFDSKHEISFDELGDTAREFDVSLQALIYRLAFLYRLEKEKTAKYIEAAEKYIELMKPRASTEREILPERYCDLARRALREGKISVTQFAKYMNIGYKEAQTYLSEEEDFMDEKVSIPTS
jgi:Zn-dependent peptidase ImmA (M78 family)/transcriptional regulator with XRE-family HTH domain